VLQCSNVIFLDLFQTSVANAISRRRFPPLRMEIRVWVSAESCDLLPVQGLMAARVRLTPSGVIRPSGSAEWIPSWWP
jgi:hypothetical protein